MTITILDNKYKYELLVMWFSPFLSSVQPDKHFRYLQFLHSCSLYNSVMCFWLSHMNSYNQEQIISTGVIFFTVEVFLTALFCMTSSVME